MDRLLILHSYYHCGYFQPVIEFDRIPNPLRDEIIKGHKFELETSDGGSIAVPISSEGGLGIEVDEDAITRFHVPLVHTGIVEKVHSSPYRRKGGHR